jgi:trk system potassium uptake protein TrkA
MVQIVWFRRIVKSWSERKLSMARKQIKREYVIIGLDSFGENLAQALEELGHSVLGIDKNREVVQRLSDNIQDIVALDASDYETMLSLGIDAFETAVVAIGNDLAQAVLVTLTLKDLGVKRIVCEAQSERNRRVLLRIGADEVVAPAIESARAIAYQLVGRVSQDSRLRFANHLAIKYRPPRSFTGSIGELLAPYSTDLQTVLVAGEELILYPGPEVRISSSDELLVVGPEGAIAALEEKTARDG